MFSAHKYTDTLNLVCLGKRLAKSHTSYVSYMSYIFRSKSYPKPRLQPVVQRFVPGTLAPIWLSRDDGAGRVRHDGAMRAFLIRRWFLLALALVIGVSFCGIGSAWRQPLVQLSNGVFIRYGIVAIVLFMMALPLEARAMWRTIRRPGPPLLATGVNSLLLPLLMWAVVAAIGTRLFSAEMAAGLLVTAAVPCTLASAAVWTRRAGGNDAVAIMVTVLTNASCFLVTPFWLWQTTGGSTSLDAPAMIRKLALFVVLPMVLAQLVRLARPVGRWATRNAVPLGVAAQLGILTMVFFGSVQTTERVGATGGSKLISEIIGVIVVVLSVHITALLAGLKTSQWLGMSRADQIAVAFAGSQKTLMVGLQICLDLGFHVLPMVAFHIGQLLVDTLIADRLRIGSPVQASEPSSVSSPAEGQTRPNRDP